MMGVADLVGNAVLINELRTRMRGWRWAAISTVYVGVLGAIALGFLLRKYNPAGGDPAKLGIQLFQTLSIFQLFLLVFITPALTAGAISGERQRRTWEIMLVTPLSSFSIAWGKLLVALCFDFLLIATSLPLFCLVILFGGVTAGDIIRAFVVFGATALLLSATGLLVSALTPRLTVSFTVALFVALALTIGLSLIALYLQAGGQPAVIGLASAPFGQLDPPPLTPLAQLDPLVALLSALPSDSGGSILGGLGTVSHAFRLGWQLPLWGVYTLLAGALSALLVATASAVLRGALPWQDWEASR